MSNSKGFTLIELIVVVLLMGIMSSVVFVSVAGNPFSSGETRFFEDVSMLVKEARAGAIISGMPKKVCVVPSEKVVEFGNKRLKIPSSVTLREDKLISEDEKYCFLFGENGSSSGGSLIFTWDNQKSEIAVDKFFGKIEING